MATEKVCERCGAKYYDSKHVGHSGFLCGSTESCTTDLCNLWACYNLLESLKGKTVLTVEAKALIEQRVPAYWVNGPQWSHRPAGLGVV